MHGGDIYNNSVDIDFSVNLNPYRLSGEDERAIKLAMSEGLENAGYYPDIRQTDVRAAIAEAEEVGIENVIAGSGASELIMAVTSFAAPRKALLIEPCYSGYEHAISSVADCNIVRYCLKEEDGFTLTSEVLDAITDDTDIMFVSDPVNPTGKNIDDDLLGKMFDRAQRKGVTVVYDTSFLTLSDKYAGREGTDWQSYVNKYDNLFILGSYTKNFALPGLRMGYIMSTKRNIAGLTAHLPEWNLSCVAASVMKACAGISNRSDHLKRSLELIKKEREYLSEELSKTGFKVYESDTVFILIKDEKGLFEDLYESLLAQGILIRKCNDFYGLGKGYYRIAVRCHDDNIILTDTIRKITDEG